MIQRLKKILEFSSKTGWYFPGAYDARTGHSSISLMSAHITFITTISGIIALMFKDLTMGVYCSMGYSVLMLSFYLLRSLGKVKVGKDGIELEDDDNETPEKEGK
jgi:hypothetical protein